ncbi:conserved hypothetical protein [Beutenbergia cavernae DSM 12333]|uniref:Integral membrane protein n=1 Tax=Beutenbergia cavernae (strain ATCC BAA-8 / DSM 12333 / CCUG 43141 / JCM 11478 / NBRC 16432 / NCIMB 13614 / HKI 0122) TaxID=471853 RepID=C5BZU5_BEUC1|nr:hypothetical protein [Beutenbergia cavernae]ACQ81275.1 conserved hypothetical protein [Beutenbergia cavernae DSM 12333]
MQTLYYVLLVLHLIGWAITLGGVLVNFRPPRIATGVMHGILTALVTGILMVGIASASDAVDDPNNMKIGVKLVIALLVTGLVIFGARRPEKVTAGLLGSIAGLTVVNIAIAVLWR